MTTRTAIEWADYSLNPGIYGCTEVSRACLHCYAATMAHRQVAMGNYPEGITAKRASGVHWSGVVKVDPNAIGPAFDKLPKSPHRDGRPRRVFVTSMADLFHADVDDDFIGDVFEQMRIRPHLIFMVLTKRPDRAAAWSEAWAYDRWHDNVWAGTTVEHQDAANERIPHLLRVPARIRFLSCEPLVGPIRFEKVPGFNKAGSAGQDIVRRLWVIAGGESGPKAAPSHPDWFRSLRDQCAIAEVPFFFKQHGAWVPICWHPDHESLYVSNREANEGENQATLDDLYGRRCTVPHAVIRYDGKVFDRDLRDAFLLTQGHPSYSTFMVGKHAAGRLLDGREWSEVPS